MPLCDPRRGMAATESVPTHAGRHPRTPQAFSVRWRVSPIGANGSISLPKNGIWTRWGGNSGGATPEGDYGDLHGAICRVRRLLAIMRIHSPRPERP